MQFLSRVNYPFYEFEISKFSLEILCQALSDEKGSELQLDFEHDFDFEKCFGSVS